MTAPDTEGATVEVPAIAVYAAALLVNHNDQTEEQARLGDLIEKTSSLSSVAKGWLDDAALRAHEGIIPFRRSSLDLRIAAACYLRLSVNSSMTFIIPAFMSISIARG